MTPNVNRPGRALLLASSLSMLAAAPAEAAIISIDAMTRPNVVLDFDQMPAGPTTVAAINAAFPGAGIVSIEFTLGFSNGDTFYDSATEAGRALGATANGGLILVDPDTAAATGEPLAVTIVLDRLITEFGFALGDYVTSTASLFELFDGAQSVGSIENTGTPPETQFFQSSVSFNTITFRNPLDWVIPELVFETAPRIASGVAGGNDVPEPGVLALLAIGGLGAFARRQRSKP